ncbi:hypothetical protein L596_014217 [Steinernema carpocapsae]|uniref:Uncharacterized protein n=1 Tax=Steinernema carpocapsae TaxID=34508 RepID=A0A4U5NBF8_STECR|nr:hypothetical protein L596_014217 [Steinernema carpocapsae]
MVLVNNCPLFWDHLKCAARLLGPDLSFTRERIKWPQRPQNPRGINQFKPPTGLQPSLLYLQHFSAPGSILGIRRSSFHPGFSVPVSEVPRVLQPVNQNSKISTKVRESGVRFLEASLDVVGKILGSLSGGSGLKRQNQHEISEIRI